MAYCGIPEIDSILAQSLTSATNPASQTRRNLLLIGKVRDKNVISDDIVNQYIQWASQEVDARLSALYKTPLGERVAFSTLLASDITEYNPYLVLEKSCALTPGDIVLVTDGITEERHIISEVIGNAIFNTVDPISYPFSTGSRVLNIKIPDPIPWITVRLAASQIYDKYFAAQVSPNTSDYGKELRKQANQKINDILNGRTILIGVERTGRRLYDPNITDQYGLPHGGDLKRDIDVE